LESRCVAGEERGCSKKERYYNDTNSWVLESRVKACLLKEERERERDVVVHPFPKKIKIEGEKELGIF
jgi:hypothetical protein